MSRLHIDRIGLEGAAAAFDLFQRFFIEEGFTTPLDQMRRSVEAMIRHPGTAVFLAWQVDQPGESDQPLAAGHPVAAATVRCTPSLEHGLYAEIEDLYVLPQARGRGVARALVEACCAWCRAEGCASVEVCITPEAEAAHHLGRFYSGLGFANSGRSLWSRPLPE